MAFWSKLFGGGGGDAAPIKAVEYNGFSITPEPMQEDGGFRLSAIIEKDGRRHHLIRADILRDADDCAKVSVEKAQQVIDQQGDNLFR